MIKFKVGDIVEGLSDYYEITNKRSKCRIREIRSTGIGSGMVKVETLESSSPEFQDCILNGDTCFWVDPDYFRLLGELLFTEGVK